jgi:hypothetical protein
LATFFATLFRRGFIDFFTSARAALLPASSHVVDGRPGTGFGFFLFDTPIFVALGYVFGLPLLFVRVFVFVTLSHDKFLHFGIKTNLVRI